MRLAPLTVPMVLLPMVLLPMVLLQMVLCMVRQRPFKKTGLE
tara:strand:+ start:3760 stop:3885 length:126 start_codon:yes stop_codon:yes gene_type:complete